MADTTRPDPTRPERALGLGLAPGHSSASPPDVSVLIVSYRVREDLARCLESLRDLDGEARAEIVVLDNDSGDGTLAMLRDRFPEVVTIDAGENVGFGRGVNRAADRASGRYLLLLNPDTVVEPGMVDALLDAAARHPGAGLIGGRTLRDDGGLEASSAWAAPSLRSVACFAAGLTALFPTVPACNPEAMVGWDRDDEREVDVVTGALLLVSRPVWDELGGFDHDFFMYAEDIDLALRARNAGYRPIVTPSAVAVHTVGASSSAPAGRRVLVLAGRMTLFDKHWSRPQATAARLLIVGGVALRAVVATARSRLVPGRTDGGWPEVWSRRQEWVDGYPRSSS